MRVAALACLALLPCATAVAAQEVHTAVLVRAVVVPPVQSGISGTPPPGMRSSTAGATSSRQLTVSSAGPVLISVAVRGRGGSVAWRAWAGRAPRASGSVGRELTLPLAEALRKAETLGAPAVTISVAVN